MKVCKTIKAQFFGNSLVSCLRALEQTLKVASRRQTEGRYLAIAKLPDSGTMKSKPAD